MHNILRLGRCNYSYAPCSVHRLHCDTVLYHIEFRHLQSRDVPDLQYDLDALQKWKSTWLIELNPSKCQHMHIALKHE